MKKILALIVVLLMAKAGAMAQVVLTPLLQEDRRSGSAHAEMRLASNSLSLPFFDDFAASASVPDPTLWINGGVYINNRFAFEPITKNVASFDGLDARGMPYAPGSVGTGSSDTLTSQLIQLNNLTPADSVYLSFYWQSGGLGNIPDRSEQVSLLVEFKDASGNWQQVWRQAGPGESTPFTQAFVAVKDAKFFHDSFQFRFRSIGQRNGLADVWNIDYVLLNKNRRKGENVTRDIAISEGVSKLLKHYTAMPANQFLQHEESELAEEVRATVNNLGSLPGAISWRGYIKRLNETSADTFLRNQALIPSNARQFSITGTPTLENTELPKDPFTLVHGIVLRTNEVDLQQRANDSTERTTEFADYYAYDDGSAEEGFSFPGTTSTQVAQRYDLNKPDQVEAFRIYFPRVSLNLSGTSITFKVWDDENGLPGKTLHQQSFQIRYSDSLNEFYEVQLSKLVPVEGKFYVGWQQPGNLFVNVGFDRNERATGRRFLFTAAAGWFEDTSTEGALMIRPVMAGEALSIEEELEAARIKVFPNPAAGKVFIEGEYENLQVYDVTGKQVRQHQYAGDHVPVMLDKLAPGLYTLRIQTRKAIITKKLILTKL